MGCRSLFRGESSIVLYCTVHQTVTDTLCMSLRKCRTVQGGKRYLYSIPEQSRKKMPKSPKLHVAGVALWYPNEYCICALKDAMTPEGDASQLFSVREHRHFAIITVSISRPTSPSQAKTPHSKLKKRIAKRRGAKERETNDMTAMLRPKKHIHRDDRTMIL